LIFVGKADGVIVGGLVDGLVDGNADVEGAPVGSCLKMLCDVGDAVAVGLSDGTRDGTSLGMNEGELLGVELALMGLGAELGTLLPTSVGVALVDGDKLGPSLATAVGDELAFTIVGP